MIKRITKCEPALVPRALSRGGLLILLLLATPAFAFEPMPPIMQKLLEVFPEENGRFVDEPFGSVESMPKEARPLFETFRVVVPTPDDIDKNLARLFSASSHFPIKKITRYDKEPGAPGLPGFRGAWCQTEDEGQVGFSIVTINQNRFLIWAKMGYYPAFANDSINPKVRDQYARDVSQYLAGIDFKVPENEAPQASGRGLPEWMGLFGQEGHEGRMWESCRDSLRARESEIRSWGFRGIWAFAPTPATIDSMVEGARDTLWENAISDELQTQFRRVDEGFYSNDEVQDLTKGLFDSLTYGLEYEFAVDRYGRVRICQRPVEGEANRPVTLLFPFRPLLTHGVFATRRVNEWAQGIPAQLETVRFECSPFFLGRVNHKDGAYSLYPALDDHAESAGHFLRVMQ